MKPIPSIEHFWKLKNFSPTKEQQQAIHHTKGPLFLTAGPGSGKTRVLLWRTLNLVVYHSVQPDEIFLSTFTEKAALQLKDGLRSLLASVTNETGRPFDISGMALGTVHSICNTIISDRRFAPEGQRRHAPNVMDELSQYFFLYNRNRWIELIDKAGFKNEEDAQRSINLFIANKNSSSRHEAVQNTLKLFNRMSEEMLDPRKIKKGDEVLLKMLLMYEHYRKLLNEQHPKIKSVDLALLQQEAHTTMTAHKNGNEVFRHVIIDEYQDTNSIQEKIFFAASEGTKNICVVGDDDQALYRFRGATVENLVEFEERCKVFLKQKPTRIDLVKNFRSRKEIVDTYNHFIQQIDWKKKRPLKGHHRIHDKVIVPHSTDKGAAVVVTSHEKPPQVAREVAQFVKDLKKQGKIEDYNQVAFLFPSLKGNSKVAAYKEAFEEIGVEVYAPRAGNFLEVEESLAVFGIFSRIFGRAQYDAEASGGLKQFYGWLGNACRFADKLIEKDKNLSNFIAEKREELKTVLSDYELLVKAADKQKWKRDELATDLQLQKLQTLSGLSEKAKKILGSQSFIWLLQRKRKEGKPFNLDYIINRVTAVDWSVMDLFYQLCGFDYFKKAFDLAEDGRDEAPVCNLALVSEYVARFMEERPSIINARFLSDNIFVKVFFSSYLYAIYRLAQSEFENADDPFPKGRVPFLTIHQSKGLEFPVVVLGSVYKRDFGVNRVEEIARELTGKKGEPLERLYDFDTMRMFYVALSRAQNLVVLPHYKGGSAATEVFKSLFEENRFTLLPKFKLAQLPAAKLHVNDLGGTYSFTGDYIAYNTCPRHYMIFRKYGFVPSRSQTMFFGSLVHQTIEDLHQLLISKRKAEAL